MAMEVVQVLTTITIYYPTLMLSPQVELELVNDTLLYTRINRRIQFHLFGGEVYWPGNVTVTLKGVLAMQFHKKIPEEWKEPFTSIKTHVTNADVPIVWNYTIVSKVEDAADLYIVSIRPERRMYFHICVGYYISITRDLFNHRLNRFVKISHQFSPMPEFPLETLDVPNPSPGKWRSMLMNVLICVRSIPTGSFGHWLLQNPPGNVVEVSPPYGSLYLPMFNKVEYLHLLTLGSGISSMLGVILYLLQMSTIKLIQVLYFNRYDTEIFLKDGITSISMIDERFVVRHIIASPSPEWKGLKGLHTLDVIEKFVPKFDVNSTNGHYCGICGFPRFLKDVERILIDDLKYPWTRIHNFVGE